MVPWSQYAFDPRETPKVGHSLRWFVGPTTYEERLAVVGGVELRPGIEKIGVHRWHGEGHSCHLRRREPISALPMAIYAFAALTL